MDNNSDVGDHFQKHIWWRLYPHPPPVCLFDLRALLFLDSWISSLWFKGYNSIICLGGPGLIWHGIYAPFWWQYMLSAWHTETNGIVRSGCTPWKVVLLSSIYSRKLPLVPAATLKGQSTDYLLTLIHEKYQWDNPVNVFFSLVFPSLALLTDREGNSHPLVSKMSFTHHKRVCAACHNNWELLFSHYSRALAELKPVWSLLSEKDQHD